MKILFYNETILAFNSGIWLHRVETPSQALMRRGHGVKQVAIGAHVPQEFMDWPDVVMFGRTYPAAYDPIKIMREYKKLGKRVGYDMDDDFWQVAKDNPSSLVSNSQKDQYEGMIREADFITTPSEVLAKKFKKHFKKPVFICSNGIDEDVYRDRAILRRGSLEDKELTIGYMGAASHWKDLQLIGEVLDALAEKYNFFFTIYGITGEPMEAAIYSYNKMLQLNLQPEKNDYFRAALDFYSQLKRVKLLHVPFMPPELHPGVLSRCDIDIGIAPLEDTTFNAGKSCIKFYEYAFTGTVTLASDVMPYKEEVNYRAKNTFKDWYNKLEKLIIDPEFRAKILAQQQEWAKKNRGLETLGLQWEKALQRPGGLDVLMQQ